ncbi:MAG: BatA and WFA domain-containing protein [Candidatus Eisenbacteria bacterium]
MNITFLNAAFLLGAFAALLPLIIHLFSRRRVETVDFSSLRFLKELERRKIRRVRIRQILLLIVRSLIILAVALALARPTLSGALAAGAGHARTSVAIVVDQSASMSRQGERGSLFDEAVDVATRVAGLLDEGDQAFLVTGGVPPRSLLSGGTFSRGTLTEAIAGLVPTAAATDYTGSVRLATELLENAGNLNRELYVVGDMQRSGWSEPLLGDEAGDGRETGPGESPTVYLLQLEGSIGNLAATDVMADRRYGGTAGLYSVTAQVDNGGRRRAEVPVRLFVDGVQVGRAGVDLDPGERGSAQFSVAVQEDAWHSGWVELPPDALETDDRAYFTIPPARTTEILVVEPDGEPERNDAYYAVRALDPSGDHERFKPVTVPLSSLMVQHQGRFPAVVLADVGRIDADAGAWLERHIDGGSGVVFILGDRTDVRTWNEGEVPGSSLVTLVEAFERPAGVRLAPHGHGHPLLDGLAFGERLIDEISMRRGFVAEVDGGDDVLELPGLGPALVLVRGSAAEGSGEVAVFLTALDPDWNDLSRSGFLVPLLHRVVDQVSGRAAHHTRVLVGEDLEVELPGGSHGRVEVTLPDGTTTTPEHRSGVRPAAVLRNASSPGLHVFTRDGSVVGMGAVNLDPRESDLTPAEPSEIERYLGGREHRFVDAAGDIGAAILEARRGRELWRVLVYAAVVLLAVEMYLARQRSA